MMNTLCRKGKGPKASMPGQFNTGTLENSNSIGRQSNAGFGGCQGNQSRTSPANMNKGWQDL